MNKRKWTKEEIHEFRCSSFKRLIFYYNKEDANLFVPREFGYGWSVNFAHPLSWVISAAIIIIIVIGILFDK